MEAIEFYTLDDELWYRTAEGTNARLTENYTELIQKLLLDISERYPEAYWKSHATLTLLAKQDCPLWLQYD